MLFSDRPTKRDDFYSELCSKRSRGLARVWTLELEGNIICTVGAYALANGQAYMACGETVEALRGKGIGGRLIAEMANALAAEGWMPVFLCSPERVHFYTRLGFEKMGSMQGMPRREAGLRAGGAGVERGYAGLSSLLRAKREPEMVLAPVRGVRALFIKANCSLLMSKENQKSTSDFDALDPREKGLLAPSDPEGVVEAQNASRFAKRIFGLLRFTASPMVLRFRRTLRSARA